MVRTGTEVPLVVHSPVDRMHFCIGINAVASSPSALKDQDNAVRIDHGNLCPVPTILNDEHRLLVILGSVLRGERFLSVEDFVKLTIDDVSCAVAGLNGQFCIYWLDKRGNRFYAFTDRTASYPVFYFVEGKSVTCSLAYSDIWLRDVDLDINPEAFYELFTLRRLLGTHTFDRRTRYLPSSAQLEVDLSNGAAKVKRTHTPNFRKREKNFRRQVLDLSDLIVQAVGRRLSDGKKAGLLLSGGLDSRVPLAVRKDTFSCFTLGYKKNNEFQVASEVAALDGHSHRFLPLPDDLYDTLYPEAVLACDGMRDFHSAAFQTVASEIRTSGVEVLFSGFALDYLLGDNYLPRTPVRFLGRDTLAYRCRPWGEDLARFFLETISWRYKSSPVEELFRSGDVLSNIHDSLQREIEVFRDWSERPEDQYLMLTLDNLSRHSMFVESILVRPFVEDRTPGLDNDLIDYAHGIPLKHRLNYKLYHAALKKIDPKYLEVRTANSNYKAGLGPGVATLSLYKNRLRRKLGLSATFPPGPSDRTWGDPKALVDRNPNVRRELSAARSFLMWDILPMLDREAICTRIDDHVNGHVLNWVLVRLVLSTETMIRFKS